MRLLYIGVIAATVSVAAWIGVEHCLHKDLGGLAILVGLVTGWAIHKSAGTKAARGYWRGSLAAVLTLTAIVCGRLAYAKIMQSTNDHVATITKVSVAATIEDDDKETEGSTDSLVGEPDVAQKPAQFKGPTRGSLVDQNTPRITKMKQLDMLWMSVAALVAYVVGKGSVAVPVTVLDIAPELPEEVDEQ